MDPTLEVWKAWNNPGPVPEYHYHWQRRLREEWPTLADALDALPAPAKRWSDLCMYCKGYFDEYTECECDDRRED